MNMPLLLFENLVFAHSNKEAIPKQKIILQGREMDEPVAESSIGNSYEAPRTRGLAAIGTSIKKVLESEPSQSTIHECLQALSNATRERSRVQKRKTKFQTNPKQ